MTINLTVLIELWLRDRRNDRRTRVATAYTTLARRRAVKIGQHSAKLRAVELDPFTHRAWPISNFPVIALHLVEANEREHSHHKYAAIAQSTDSHLTGVDVSLQRAC